MKRVVYMALGLVVVIVLIIALRFLDEIEEHLIFYEADPEIAIENIQTLEEAKELEETSKQPVVKDGLNIKQYLNIWSAGPEKYLNIESIKIETISSNIKDGFKVLVNLEHKEYEDEINYLYRWKHNDSDIVGAEEDELKWSDSFKKGDVIAVKVIPYHRDAESVWKYETSVKIPNSPPKIISKPKVSFIGKNEIAYQVKAKDRDEGDELKYLLKNAPMGMSISETGKVTWKYGKEDVGEHKFLVTVSDGDGGKFDQTVKFIIEENL